MNGKGDPGSATAGGVHGLGGAVRGEGQLRSRSPPGGRQKDPAYWLSAIEEDWRRLQHAPVSIKSTPDVVAEAMRQSEGLALRWAADELRADSEFLMGAAKEIGICIIGHASEKLRADRDFILELSQELGAEVLTHASPTLRVDRDFVLEVADYCSPGDILEHAPEEVRAILLADREFVQEALQQVGAEILRECSPTLLGDRQFMVDMASWCGPAGGEVLAYATEELRSELFADHNFVLQAVRDMGVEVLEDASSELRSNRDFMMEAASYCSEEEAMQYATDELRIELDPNFVPSPPVNQEVTTSVVPDGCDLKFVSEQRSMDLDPQQAVAAATPKPKPPIPPTRPSPMVVAPLPKPTQVSPPPPLGLAAEWLEQTPAAMVPTGHALATTVSMAQVRAAAAPLGQAPAGTAQMDLVVQAPALAPTSSEAWVCGHDPYGPPPLEAPSLLQTGPEPALPASAVIMLDPVNPVGVQHLDVMGGTVAQQPSEVLPFVQMDVPMLPVPDFSEPYMSLQLDPEPEPAPQPQVDRHAVLQALRMLGPQAIENASSELRGDREFMLAAATSPVEALRQASDQLRFELSSDKTFMVQVAQQIGPDVFQYASPTLRADRDFVLKASPSPGQALRYASQSLRDVLHADREFMLKAVKEVGKSALQDASSELRGDKDFIFEVTSTPEEALRYASPTLRKELHANRAFMLKAVREGGISILCHASAELRANRDFILEAVPSPREALWYASQPLRKKLHADRDFMLKHVKEVGSTALRSASASLRGDKDFILTATKTLKEALQWASPQLKETLYADREFVLRAVQEIGKSVLNDASAELRGNRDFVLQVAPSRGDALKLASEALRGVFQKDRQFMTEVVKELGVEALKDVSEELRGDLGFMLSVAAFCPEAMRYASDELRAEMDSDDED